MKMMNGGGILIPLPLDLKIHVHIDSCPSLKSPSTLKKYLKKAKEELWKLKYFTMQKHNLQNIILQRSSCKNRPIIT
jgi:hypothetical protein